MILLLPACLSELIDMMLIPYAQTSKSEGYDEQFFTLDKLVIGFQKIFLHESYKLYYTSMRQRIQYFQGHMQTVGAICIAQEQVAILNKSHHLSEFSDSKDFIQERTSSNQCPLLSIWFWLSLWNG